MKENRGKEKCEQMLRQKNALNKEKIVHTTQAEPYSVYKVYINGSGKGGLYLHWHPEAELFYVQNGEVDFYIENDLYHLLPGNAIFVPPGLLHYAVSTSEENVVSRALVFATELVVEPTDTLRFQKYIQPVLQDNRNYSLLLDAGEEWHSGVVKDLERIFEAIDAKSDVEDDNETDLLVEGLIRVIWHEIYRYHFKNLCKLSPAGRAEAQVQRVFRFIQEHYQEEISLSMLAKVVHINEAQLCRSFKKVTGNTIFSYLKRYRILKSYELLCNSDKKIQEICSLCGFNNISYYNREFLKLMKMTPSECRKNL